MTDISAKRVKELRDRSGVGMAKCKQALVEAKGDMDEAINILRKKGIASAVKKEGREAKEGCVHYAENEECIALLEVNAETDFVVQNQMFKDFVENLCQEVLLHKPRSLEAFLGAQYSRKPGVTIDEYRVELVSSLGENIRLRRVKLIHKQAEHSYGIYSHMGGKIVSLVDLAGSNRFGALARNFAMHVAAEAPEYLSSENVPQEVKEKEREIGRSQVQGKPENIVDKIVEGKLRAFYEQACLLDQKYVRDSSQTVGSVVTSEGKGAGVNLKLESFVRWSIGGH